MKPTSTDVKHGDGNQKHYQCELIPPAFGRGCHGSKSRMENFTSYPCIQIECRVVGCSGTKIGGTEA